MHDRTETPLSVHQPPTPAPSLDELLAPSPGRAGEAFPVAFRGYDRDEVDHAFTALAERQRSDAQRLAQLDRQRRKALGDTAAGAQRIQELEAELATRVQELEAELKVSRAKTARAEKHVRTLTGELKDGAARGEGDRSRFEEVLRVAEEQASVIIKNASVQGERLILAANEDIAKRKTEAKADADALMARARHEAQQVRLRMDTELAAHEALVERQAAHAAERVAQADQEAATVRTEADRGAAALRAHVTRETEQQRAQAEEAVRELRLRALEFDESLTRRQDDAQQEFLMLHNQAVAHAERITHDANTQVAASLEHAQRVSAKAADFDRLMRSQAAQIEAQAHARAGETLERARTKAQRIIDTVTGHSQAVLRDAEDRARTLRWQGQQLSTFMAEMHEMIRPEVLDPEDDVPAPAEDGGDASDADGPEAVGSAEEATVQGQVAQDDSPEPAPAAATKASAPPAPAPVTKAVDPPAPVAAAKASASVSATKTSSGTAPRRVRPVAAPDRTPAG